MDHGSLCHPAPHSLHWPPAPLRLPCLPGLPLHWTLASALPGKHFANEPQGFTQVIAGSEMEGAPGGGVNGKQLPVSQGAGGGRSTLDGIPQTPLGAVFFQP